MNEWLRKLGLQKEFTVELFISKSVFMELLQNQIHKPRSFFRDLFNFHQKDYTGKVGESDFELKSNAWSNNSYANKLTIIGKVRKEGEKLCIEVTVPSHRQSRGILEIYSILLFIFLLIPFTVFIFAWYFSIDTEFFNIIIWLFGFLVVLSISYFFTRQMIRELAEDFDRDIRRMVKENSIQGR
jgi:hypothetical protein